MVGKNPEHKHIDSCAGNACAYEFYISDENPDHALPPLSLRGSGSIRAYSLASLTTLLICIAARMKIITMHI